MKQILALSLFLFLYTSCKKKQQPDFNESMKVSVYEDLSNKGKQVMLTFETARALNCGSAVIQGDATVSGLDVTVTITGIATPQQCQYAPRKVSRSFGLGALADGTYNLVVKNGKYISNGTLKVSRDKLGVSFSQLENLGIGDSTMMRVPDGIIWGNVMYASLTQEHLADSFVSELIRFGASPATLPDGAYHYFTIASGGIIVAYNGVNLYSYRKDFVYSFTGAKDSLQKIATDYAFLNPSANFYVRTWDGANFNYPGAPLQ